MGNPSDHLVRTASIDAAVQALSAMTGLSRLNIELHRCTAGATISLPAGAERFVYVLEGEGILSITGADGGQATALGPGDFVALEPLEAAELSTGQSIAVLSGGPG